MDIQLLMKRVYFIVLSTMIVGFVAGVMFELDRKNSTPVELVDRIPRFLESVFSPTTTTITSKKDKVAELAKLIVQKQRMIGDIEQYLKSIKSVKDKKQKEELCKKIFNIRMAIKQIDDNIEAKDKKIGKRDIKELIKIANKIRRHCYLAKNVKDKGGAKKEEVKKGK